MSFPNLGPVMPSMAHDAKVHERKVDGQESAAKAQGIDGDDKESEASSGDRDADGRQAWRWTRHQGQHKEELEHLPPDLSGMSGNSLDLNG